MNDWYHVFRRFPEGYVAAIATSSSKPSYLTREGIHGTFKGEQTSFEILLVTQDWIKARDLIEQERSKPGYPDIYAD